MKGLDKFKSQIKAEVDKVKDAKKKKLIEAEANEIIKHLTKVCDKEYDDLLNQPHKSFERMWRFVTNNAREMAVNNCSMVKDEMVFGWIDEYVGLDDKAEVEKEEQMKVKTKSVTETKKTATKTTTNKKTITVVKKEEMEQISIFDLM